MPTVFKLTPSYNLQTPDGLKHDMIPCQDCFEGMWIRVESGIGTIRGIKDGSKRKCRSCSTRYMNVLLIAYRILRSGRKTNVDNRLLATQCDRLCRGGDAVKWGKEGAERMNGNAQMRMLPRYLQTMTPENWNGHIDLNFIDRRSTYVATNVKNSPKNGNERRKQRMKQWILEKNECNRLMLKGVKVFKLASSLMKRKGPCWDGMWRRCKGSFFASTS